MQDLICASEKLQSCVGGQWVDGPGPDLVDENPARRGEVVATYRSAGGAIVDAAVEAAQAAFDGWRRTTIFERGAVLHAAARLLEERAEAYGEELTREEGKTRAEGIGEVRRAAEVLAYHAAAAAAPSGEIFPSARPGEQIWTWRVPVGPLAVITPWNFPIFIPSFKLGPALLHGNTVVWKPAELVPLLAVRLMEVLAEAGLPPGVCNLVLGGPDEGQRLVDHPGVLGCTFTGSTAVGSDVVATCARRGIKSHAEMGGKNTLIVLDDADLDAAAAAIVSGAMRSTGQKCTATSRVVIERSVFDETVERVASLCRGLVVGDPMDEGTDLGPVVSERAQQRILGHVAAARSEGARLVCGGGPGPDDGYYVEPTFLVDVDPGQAIFTDEVFGPVLVAVSAADEVDALRLANTGPFGLSGGVFTRDIGRVMRMADRFDVGVLHVNSETTGADPHVPFGGVKASGTASREQGMAAREFFTDLRTVYVASSDPDRGATR